MQESDRFLRDSACSGACMDSALTRRFLSVGCGAAPTICLVAAFIREAGI